MNKDPVPENTADVTSFRRVYDISNYLPHKLSLVFALTMVQMTGLFSPFLTGKVIDILSSVDDEHGSTLTVALTALMGVYMFGWVFRYYSSRQLIKSLLEFEKRLRLQLWDGFVKMPLGEYETTSPGVFHSKMSRDISNLSMTIQVVTEVFFTSIILGFGAVVLTLCLQPWLFVVVAVVLSANVVAYFVFQQHIDTVAREAQNSNESLHRLVFDLIEMIPTFRVFSVMDRYRSHFQNNIDENINVNLKLNRANVQFATVVSAISDLGWFSMLVTAVIMCMFRKITVGDVVLYQLLFSHVLDGIGRIVFMLPSIQKGRESLYSIHPILIMSQVNEKKLLGTLCVTKGAIQFNNVNFTYPENDSNTLVGVTCAIAPGEHVVILGKNGSGKSTFARLLLGYYKPDAGTIYVDGIPSGLLISEVNAKKIVFVPQVVRIYQDSVLENIRLRDTSLSQAIAIETARRCNLTRFANDLNEIVTQQTLSGGEMQCIAIARALIRNPNVIILDEITSHLDIYSKERIFNVLRNLHGSCTIITITHDIEFAGLADRVMIMDEGRLYDVNNSSPPVGVMTLVEAIGNLTRVDTRPPPEFDCMSL